MKRALTIILAVLDFVIFCLLSIFYWSFIHDWKGASGEYLWGLPFLVAGLLALIGGIVTMKKEENWGYGILGLIIAIVISVFAFSVLRWTGL